MRQETRKPFGGRIKQLAPVGPSSEIIMDYSIHDAGSRDLISYLHYKKDLEKDFGDHRKPRIERIAPVSMRTRDDDLPEDFLFKKKEAVGNRSGDPCGEKFN